MLFLYFTNSESPDLEQGAKEEYQSNANCKELRRLGDDKTKTEAESVSILPLAGSRSSSWLVANLVVPTDPDER